MNIFIYLIVVLILLLFVSFSFVYFIFYIYNNDISKGEVNPNNNEQKKIGTQIERYERRIRSVYTRKRAYFEEWR